MIEHLQEKLEVLDKLVATGKGSRMDHIIAQQALKEFEALFSDEENTQPTQTNQIQNMTSSVEE